MRLDRLTRVRHGIGRRLRSRREPLHRLLVTAARQHDDGAWSRIWDDRRALVRRLAPGRSFLDVGGMFGVHGELAFLAEECGATRVALFDGMDPTPEFERTHTERASAVQFHQGDVHDPRIVGDLGPWDVVWCTGVVYHSPHPLQQLQHLRGLTTDTLVLGSLVLPEVPGIEQVCVLYPGTSARMQSLFAEVYGGAGRFPGMAVPFDETPLMAYVNMWWGLTPSALRSMLRFTGFDVVAEHQQTPFSLDLVARVGGVDPGIYPPLNQSLGRVRRRIDDAGGDVPAYATDQARRR